VSKTMKHGVWPVMITPFLEDNKIDYNGVLRIIEWYHKQKVAGIFAVCQSSEMFFLDRKERYELAKFVRDNAPNDMGVVVSGHVEDKIEAQIEEAKAVIDTGADAYVFISNKLAAQDESEDIVKKNIDTLIRNIPADHFGIYECPYPYKRLLSPELLKWCADTGRFTFLKDTCCDLTQLKAKIDIVKGTSLKVYNANAATLLESLRMGGAGYSGVMANFHADLYVWLCKNYDNNPEKAEELQAVLGAASIIECQTYPTNAKYHMQLEGVDITLNSRVQSKELLTGSRKLEVEQFQRAIELYRKHFMKSEML
jgi:4-hydroxy-tetrahydrodipicolinate synthase